MAKQVRKDKGDPVGNATRSTAECEDKKVIGEAKTATGITSHHLKEDHVKVEGEQEKIYFEMVTKVYTSVQEQIRFADTKAVFVAAFNAILIGFIATNLSTIKDIYKGTHDLNTCIWLVVLSFASGIPTAVSIGYVILAVRPRLGKNTHRSRIFFGHIARDYDLDGARYRNDAHAMGQNEWADDFGCQIVESASIAQEKHSNVRASMTCSFVSFVALVVVSLGIHAISIFYLPSTNSPTGQSVEHAARPANEGR